MTGNGLPSSHAHPDINLEGLASERVKCEAWSASAKGDPPSFTRGYAVKAAPDAPAEERDVRVRVSLSGVTITGKLKIAVKPAGAKPGPTP